MKPIGTVTKYYPFLTEETRAIVKKHVENARDYRDFVNSLIKTTTDLPMSSQLSQFMLTQATTIGSGFDEEIWEKIHPRCQEHVSTRPWHYWNNSEFRAGQIEAELSKALEEAISSVDDEWLFLHIYLVGPQWMGPRLHLYERYMEKARRMIENNPKLLCFAPRLYYVETIYETFMQGDHTRVIESYDKIRKIAEKHDDVFWIGVAYRRQADAIRNIDPHYALEILAKAQSIFESLGDTLNMGEVMSTKGVVHSILGEYDFALDTLFNAVEVSKGSMSSRGIGGLLKAVYISRIFCDLNEPDQALEWLNWAERKPQRTFRYFILNKARVMTQLRRFDEAMECLEDARERFHETGDDIFLALYNQVTGIYELTTGKTKDALHTLQEAFVEFERLDFQNHINSCLLFLTRTEIAESASSWKPDRETSGPWMTILEKHARDRNYHGIRMQHALLKADYQLLLGEDKAAVQTLREALSFSESAGVETLRNRIFERLKTYEVA